MSQYTNKTEKTDFVNVIDQLNVAYRHFMVEKESNSFMIEIVYVHIGHMCVLH